MTDHGVRPPAGVKPRFEPGARVLWTRSNGKVYPATVEKVDWYRRTREPWGYMIRLDASAATARMQHLLRFPPESQLSHFCPDDGRCIHYPDESRERLPFPHLTGVSSETTLPDGTPRLITEHFEPDQRRYGSH
jgi:hypothetical protein